MVLIKLNTVFVATNMILHRKALSGFISSFLRLNFESRAILQEQIVHLITFFTSQTCLITQFYILKWKC